MFPTPVNCFFPDFVSTQNMVLVVESKIIRSEGIKKLHVCLVIARGYQGRVNEVYVLNDTYVVVNNVANLCIYRPK